MRALSDPLPPAAAERAAPSVSALVGAVSLAVFMSSLDLFIVNLAFPYLAVSFHDTNLGQLSWVLNGYTIVFAAVLVPAGRFADRVGRRRVLVAGLVLFGAGSLACGLAPGVWWLVGARLVQAVGSGMMVPASLSLLLALAPAGLRAQAIGTWSALGALGAACGPVVGGALVQLDWRWVFWVNLPVGVLAVVLARRVLPESRDEQAAGRPDLAGAALLAAAAALIALALVEAPTWGWTSLRVLAVLAGAALAAAGVARRSARHAQPVIERAVLRSPGFGGALAASVLYYAAFGAFVLNTVEFLTGVWHYSALRAGLAIGPGPLVVLPVARLVAPRLASRIGPARVAVLGCVLGAAAQLLWWSRLEAHAAYLSHLLPVQLLGGAAVGLAIPSLLAAGSAALPPERFGTGSGVLNLGRQLGTVLGVAGLVAILSRGGPDPFASYRDGVLLVTGFFAAAGVVAAIGLAVSPRRAGAPVPLAVPVGESS